MICIILVAGHGTLLEQEIKNDPDLEHLIGIPKALLPASKGKTILDFWWESLKTRQLFSEVYLVTNADKYKYFERWATASDFPVENIINDGTTSRDHSLGAMADFELVLRMKKVLDDVMVVAGDMLFEETSFDISQVIKFFRVKSDGDLAMFYEMDKEDSSSSRGIININKPDNVVTEFYEKPPRTHAQSCLASVVFYCFRAESLFHVQEYLETCTRIRNRSFGKFMEWYINTRKIKVYGMKLPTKFQLIGEIGLSEYKKWREFFADKGKNACGRSVTKQAYARVGLMGNPSDGFYGKTISMSIKNFWAEVSITESEQLRLIPHPLNDPTHFGSLADLYGISCKEGYLGGLRLLQATCKQFYAYCSEKGIALARKNFTLKYDTNIPRQVGLAGSSAIVTATLKCLISFFNLTESDMPKHMMPEFVLNVEKNELFIQGGLQDRVIQLYEGIVYMDFNKKLFDFQGHGNYEHINIRSVPKFWLAYLFDPSDSGKIHSDVHLRWMKGEEKIVAAMEKFAELTEEARSAIEGEDWEELVRLMDANFDLRRSVYGDAVLGQKNLRMIEIGRQFGSAAKFPGSGGAVVGLCLEDRKMEDMKKTFQEEGFVFIEIIPNIPIPSEKNSPSTSTSPKKILPKKTINT